jgi:hypothetical protein
MEMVFRNVSDNNIVDSEQIGKNRPRISAPLTREVCEIVEEKED